MSRPVIPEAEELILAEITKGLLSDEAVALAKKIFQEELRRLQSHETVQTKAGPKLTKIETQIRDVRALLNAGALSSVAATAAFDALERERAEVAAAASRRDRKGGAQIIRLIPQAAESYRAAVRDIAGTLSEPSERLQARALMFELLGEKVRVRSDGKAVFARLEMDLSALVARSSPNQINCFWNGSGGVLCAVPAQPVRQRVR